MMRNHLQKPVVLLLGGALMNLHILERYWSLHNSIGYDTAAVTTEFAQYCQFDCAGLEANAKECVEALGTLVSGGAKLPVPVVSHTVGSLACLPARASWSCTAVLSVWLFIIII